MRAPFNPLSWAAVLLLSATFSAASPVPVGLSINGSVTLDTVNSAAATGAATQGGQLKYRNGGSDSLASFSGAPAGISPSSSLSGGLSATGDGFGAQFSAAGSGLSSVGPLFVDYALSLTNSSATDTFTILLRGLYSNAVNASGADAYAHSLWSFKDAGLNELVATEHSVDTLNTGPSNNFSFDSVSNAVLITLLPGASASYTAFQSLVGGSSDGNFTSFFDVFVELEDIRSSGVVNRVPEPATLALTAVALWALLRRPRRR
ncbi:PEP-CTERM sorting domain-containing protein [Roseateles sp. NT4]|uniref:PEP-CTERM sorting domain-containing protein n=1 Tax=Roseateles sp. NT4 TaxID=3453715 RepID=UPI003EF03CF4